MTIPIRRISLTQTQATVWTTTFSFLGGTITYPVTNLPKTKSKRATTMRAAGTPKASGKQSFLPKHWTSSRKTGVKNVDIRLPALIDM